jgi:hypothetical protein
MCRICGLNPVAKRNAKKCAACLAETCPTCGRVGGKHRHPHRVPRVRRDEVEVADIEALFWSTFPIAWRKAARIVGRDEGFDVAQSAITKVFELRPYLRLRGLAAYYVRTSWSLAVGRARRRGREVPMDEEMLTVAHVEEHERERGRRAFSGRRDEGRA